LCDPLIGLYDSLLNRRCKSSDKQPFRDLGWRLAAGQTDAGFRPFTRLHPADARVKKRQAPNRALTKVISGE
jgi:hypothetical protein